MEEWAKTPCCNPLTLEHLLTKAREENTYTAHPTLRANCELRRAGQRVFVVASCKNKGRMRKNASTVPSVKEILDGVATEAGLLGAFDETFTSGQARLIR